MHIENEEDSALQYSFDADSIYTEGRSAMLGIMPITGVIPSKSRAPLDMFFTAPSERDFNFNLVCRIKHRIEPLYLNVKAEGFSVKADLICESLNGQMVKLTANGRNEINLRQVEPNEQAVRSLQVINSGKYPISFTWTVTNDSGLVKITPESGDIKAGQKSAATLTFVSSKKHELKNCLLTLSVLRGPTYQIALVGKCVPPSLMFSRKTVNFGTVFVNRPGMKGVTETVEITNNDSKPVRFVTHTANSKTFLKTSLKTFNNTAVRAFKNFPSVATLLKNSVKSFTVS